MKAQGLVSGEDIRLWKGEGDVFKPFFSSYQTWQVTRVQKPKVPWSDTIWFTGATPKYSFITWLAIHNRLATTDRIAQWCPQVDVKCVLCLVPTETRDNLFFICPYSTRIWANLSKNILGTSYTADRSSLMQILEARGRHGIYNFLVKYVFQVSLHTIWRERNGRRHGEGHKTSDMLIRFIDKTVRNRISSLRRKTRRFDDAMVAWFGSRDA